MRILCTGDIHIGRRATRVPGGTDPREFSASQAWRDAVQLALDRQVDLVVLTGDVVDRENRYFEAFGPLEEGLRILEGARIPVVAVAGNHDFDVLPRLAASFDAAQFRLLGREGRWERHALVHSHGTLYLDGWSFPSARYARDPLAEYELPPPGDGPLLGILHADLDQAGSPYAPVGSDALRALPMTFWMLGHVHGPMLSEEPGRPGLLYPGSPLALSPKEPGPHGPWILEVTQEGRVTAEQVPLSRVRYEALEVDAGGARDELEVDRRISEAVRDRMNHLAEETDRAVRRLVCRVRLTGRTPVHRRLEGHLHGTLEELSVSLDGARATVEAVRVETRPAWDLEQLAASSGPPAVLARLILDLARGEPGPARKLLEQARAELEGLTGRLPYREVPRRDELLAGLAGTDQELAVELQRQGLMLLDELLAQKADGEGQAALEASPRGGAG